MPMLTFGDINISKASGHQENDPLGDIGGPVGDAFQVMDYPQQLGGTLNGCGVLNHVGE